MTTDLSESYKNPASRKPAQLRTQLDAKLRAYVAAAGAAGVSLLATAQPAEAHIVFTPTNTVVDSLNAAKIDFNGDGVADITIAGVSVGSYGAEINANMPAGNGVFKEGAALFFGVPIGRGEPFTTYQVGMVFFTEGRYGTFGSHGPWAGKTNRYLGVKFQIDGETHFGWVRITVKPFEAIITGYAYETVPEATIKAGYTHSPSGFDSTTASLTRRTMPVTLGLLARGADWIAVWRREES